MWGMQARYDAHGEHSSKPHWSRWKKHRTNKMAHISVLSQSTEAARGKPAVHRVRVLELGDGRCGRCWFAAYGGANAAGLPASRLGPSAKSNIRSIAQSFNSAPDSFSSPSEAAVSQEAITKCYKHKNTRPCQLMEDNSIGLDRNHAYPLPTPYHLPGGFNHLV